MDPTLPIVCHVTSVHPVPDPRIFLKQCRSLSEAGFTVHVLFAGDGNGFDWGEIRPLSVGPRSRNRLRRLLLQPAIVRALRQLRPRIVHFHDPELLPLMCLLQLMWGGRTAFIYDIHENYGAVLKAYGWPYGMIGRIYSLLLRFAEGRMSMVIAEDSYQKFLRVPRLVIHNYIDPPQALPRPEKQNTMIYLGSISELRGASLMIEAFSRLSREDWRLEIIGQPDNAPLLEHLQQVAAQKSRFPGQIEVRDYMPFSQALARIQRAKIGLCLLSPELNSVESLPTKVFDYLSCSVTVLLSDFPYYRSFFSSVPNVHFVNPLDRSAITAKMASLCTLVEAAAYPQEVADGLRVCTERFTWQAEARKLTAFYHALLQPPAGVAPATPL